MLFPLSFLSVLTSLVIILLCCFIMARYRQAFDKLKIPIAILTVLGGLSLYTIGYMSTTTAAQPLDFMSVTLRAIFSTCRIFIMESDLSNITGPLQTNALFLMVLSFVHALGAVLTVMAILSFLGMKFLSRLKLIFAKARKVYIFLGLNEASENLIKSLKENSDSRCFIVIESLKDREEDDDLVKRLREDSFILIDHDWEDVTSLRQLRIPSRLFKREVYVFALSDEDNKNVQVIYNLIKQASKDGLNDDTLHFYINTTDEGIEKTLEAVNQDNETHFEFKVFNLPDLTARQLFDTYPIHDTIPLDTEKAKALTGFTLFIAGLEPAGVEILRKSIYLGQFIGGDYRVLMTDQDMTRKIGHLYNKYPEIKRNYQIETYDAEPGSEAFYEVLRNNIEQINTIVVALGDDQTNMETAIEIQRLVQRSRLLRKPVIAVHIRIQEKFEHFKDSPILPDIRFFGRNADIFTEAIIINESMDKMARKMNALFNSIYSMEPADNWGSLDSFTKESNRSAASNIVTKLRLLGLGMREKTKPEEGKKQDTVNLNDFLVGERLDNLARQEHLRWNAFHYASGWMGWPLSETGDAKKAKDIKNKRHACLVSWDGLEEVTRHFNQKPTYQDLDYEQVKNITRILDYCGFEVYKNDTKG